MPEEGDREPPRCPECGAAYGPGAEQCPLCRAVLPSAAATIRKAGRTSRPSSVPAVAPRRTRVRRRRDLSASTTRVEETAAALAKPRATRRGPPRRAAIPTLVLAGLLCATGLILFPVAFVVGWFTLVGGISLVAVGVFLRYARRGA